MTRLRLNLESLTGGEPPQKAEVSLEEPVVLGRDVSSPLSLSGDAISRRHCRLEAREGSVYLTDLSANGTRLNGTQLAVGKRAVVPAASVIELPDYQISIDFLDAPEPAGEPGDASTKTGPLPGGITMSGQEILVALLLAAALLVVAVYWFL